MKVTNAHIKFQKFVKLSSYQSFFLKGAEVTCVEIASEIKKKCFRPKDMLNFNVLWNF